MAKRLAIPSKQLQLFLVGPKNFFKASRVQRLSFSTDVPTTQVDELGDSQHAGSTKDTPNVTLTFSAFDVSVKIFSTLTGTDYTAYPAAGVDISSLAELDAAAFVKDASVADYVKSIHAKRMQIRDFTFSYSVDGEATEDYTAIGSERRYLKYDVIMDRFVTGTTSFTLTQTPVQLANGRYALSMILDGSYLTEVTGAPATGEYRVVGTTVTTFDSMVAQAMVVYHANPAGSNWADVRDTTIPAAVKGKDIKIVISAVNVPRVQSVTINGTLNVAPVKEMGTQAIVGYQRQVPEVTGTLTVLDTDTELINLFANGAITTSGVVEWMPGEGCTTSGYPMDVKIYDPCNTATVLKTVRIPQLVITSDAFTSNVNGNATSTYNFRSNTAQCIVFSGAGS